MLLRSNQLFLIQRCLVRCISECTTSTRNEPVPNSTEPLFEGSHFEENDNVITKGSGQRSLKVAILGAPNVGKSTLINKLVGHPVFSVSKKVHTTRKRARAAVVRDNAQILFVDTPGLVSASEVKRHHLEQCFVEDGIRAVSEAHVVGVVHDVGNPWTRGRLDLKILKILRGMEADKKAFLILNKVDIVKKKEVLLELITNLTSSSKKLDDELEKLTAKTSEMPPKLREIRPDRKIHAWPNFSEVFLVSALSGDGVPEVLEYLMKETEERKWPLPPGRLTDQKHHTTLEELVRGRLLDNLPQEVPYNLVIETEYFHTNELGEIIAVVLVTCPLARHQKMLLSGNGRIIKKVATEAEADARDALRKHVRLRVIVTTRDDSKNNRRS